MFNLPSGDQIKDALAGVVDSLTKPVEVLDDPSAKGGKLVITRAPYQIHRQKPAEKHVPRPAFEDFRSLAEWLLVAVEHHPTAPFVDVLVGQERITVDLNPTSDAGVRGSCTLILHPRLSRWAAVVGRPLNQKTLQRLVASALEDFDQVRDEAGRPIISMGESLAAQLLKFSMTRDQKVEIERDSAGFVTFSAASDKVTVNGKLPPRIDLFVPVFLGDDPVEGPAAGEAEVLYRITLELDIDITEKGPVFCLAWPNEQLVKRQARVDLAAQLRQLLAKNDRLRVYLGERHVEVIP